MDESNVPFLFTLAEDTEKTIAEVQRESDSGSCEG